MTRKRIAFLIVLLIVVTGVVGGIVLIVRNSSGSKLLRRARVALHADKPAEALTLVDSYIRENPDDWHGYQVQGDALLRLDRLEESREALREAIDRADGALTPQITMADSYIIPAQQLLAPQDSAQSETTQRDAIDLLTRATELLAPLQATSDNEKSMLLERLGRVRRHMAICWGNLAKLARERATHYAATLEEGPRRKALDEADQCDQNAAQDYRLSTDAFATLLESNLGEDDDAEIALASAEALGDAEVMDRIARAVESRHEQLPKASIRRMRQEYLAKAPAATSAERRQMLADFRVRIETYRKAAPKDEDLAAALARLALVQGDPGRAEAVLVEVAPDPKKGAYQTRLLKAQALIMQNKFADAEAVLQSMLNSYSRDPEVQYLAGQVAVALGKQETGRRHMLEALKLNPGHPQAARYMADLLLKEDHTAEAVRTAQNYFLANPKDPGAIELYGRIAAKNPLERDTAAEAINAAAKDNQDSPTVLMAAHDALRDLNRPKLAIPLADRAADVAAKTVADIEAVAKARVLRGRTAEAETLVRDALKRDPDSAELHATMARIEAAQGRRLQAEQSLQRAAQLAPRNETIQLSLARRLLSNGQAEQAETIARRVLDHNPANARALAIVDEASIALGHSQDMPDAAGQAINASTRQFLQARSYLQYGQPAKAIEIAAKALQDDPNNVTLLTLLGEARLMQGQFDQFEQAYVKAIGLAPDRELLYGRLGEVLAHRLQPDQLRKRFMSLPNARGDLVRMTLGMLYLRVGRPQLASALFEELLKDSTATPETRSQARLFKARALAAMGRLTDAEAEARALLNSPFWANRAQLMLADILAQADKPNEAKQQLLLVAQTAHEDDRPWLYRPVVRALAKLGKLDDAMAVCDTWQADLPSEIAPLLTRAEVLQQAGRLEDAAQCYIEAAKRQPNDFTIRERLAHVRNQQNQWSEALAVIETASEDPATKARSLMMQAALLIQWGLAEQAIDRVRKLDELGQASDPKTRMQLAVAFAALGDRQRARAILAEIPEYASVATQARLLRAGLADTKQQTTDEMRALLADNPTDGTIVSGMMVLLDETGQPAEALKVFDAYLKAIPADAEIPPGLAIQQLRIATEHGKTAEARKLVDRMVTQTELPTWKARQLLLIGEQAPADGLKALPPAEKASPIDALLGVAWGQMAGNAVTSETYARRYLGQMEQVRRRAPGTKAMRELDVLVRTAAGLKAPEGTNLSAAGVEFLAYAKSDSKAAAAEAARLILARTAESLAMRPLATRYAKAAFDARPASLIAAAGLLQINPTTEMLEAMVQKIKPADSALAIEVRATLLRERREYAKAADEYGKLIGKPDIVGDPVYQRAVCLEMAGQREEALALYRKVWNTSHNVMAANNAAYLVTQLHADDPEQLRQASQWIEAALKASPNHPAFQDTRGWIDFLLGKPQQARPRVRAAAKGIPTSSEIHYHLGRIEEALGNAEMAQWHMATAVAVAKAAREAEKLELCDERAAEAAGKWLAAHSKGSDG